MAKWGEGDPRWLVEHREDGKNVNGWHWSEVNRLEWSKTRLAELLPGVDAAVSAADGAHSCCCRVAAVKSVTGEVALTTRKGGKRFAMYDLKITLGWESIQEAAAADAAAAAGDAAPAAAAAADCVALAVEAAAPAGDVAVDDDAPPADESSDELAQPEAAAAEAAEAAASAAASNVVTGEIVIAEFSSGSDPLGDDVELTVTASGGDSEQERQKLRAHAQRALWPAVLQRLEQFVRELEAS